MSVRILRIEMSSMPFFVDPLVIMSKADESDVVHFLISVCYQRTKLKN